MFSERPDQPSVTEAMKEAFRAYMAEQRQEDAERCTKAKRRENARNLPDLPASALSLLETCIEKANKAGQFKATHEQLGRSMCPRRSERTVDRVMEALRTYRVDGCPGLSDQAPTRPVLLRTLKGHNISRRGVQYCKPSAFDLGPVLMMGT